MLVLGFIAVCCATLMAFMLGGWKSVNLRPSDLWRWDGALDRESYLMWGLALFALKHNLDRLLAWQVLGRKWSVFDYLKASAAAPDQARLHLIMLATALPFIYTGVVMTLRRLRSAGLPQALIVLFFAPILNLPFFVTLGLLPPKAGTLTPPEPQPLAPAATAVALAVAAIVLATLVSVTGLRRYGAGLFVGLPFSIGLLSSLLYGARGPRTLRACLTVATAAMGVAGFVLLAAAIEGAMCIMMAAPLALALAYLGAFVGYLIQRAPHEGGRGQAVFGLLMLGIPGLLGADYARPAAPPLYAVTTSVIVDAPPAKVWKNVVSFSELPPPDSLLFKLGFAYPVRAKIAGRGVGAVRRCQFSTGDFVEPITTWDEPRRLAFSVTSQPAPMREWTPWAAISPPHLDRFLVSEGGQFLLTPLPDGRTKLEGTTWYRHAIEPAAYWKPYSDFIIHRIHARVLDHVRRLSEAA